MATRELRTTHLESMGGWVTWLFGRIPLPRWLAAGLLGAAVFCIGLVVASCGGLVSLYVSTKLFWLAAVGVGWVSGWLAWGYATYPHLVGKILEVVDADVPTQKAVQKQLRGMASDRTLFLLAVLLCAAGMIFLHFVIRGLAADLSKPTVLGIPRILPEQFYDGQKVSVKLALLTLFLFPAGLVLVTAVNGFVRDFVVMKVLSKRAFRVPYLLALGRLDAIGSFHAKTATSYFGGVTLVVLAAESNFTPPIVGFIVALASLGFLVFFLPQEYWRQPLEEAKDSFLKVLVTALESDTLFQAVNPSDPTWLARAASAIQISEHCSHLRTRTFDLQNVLQVVLTFSVPVASAILRLPS